jgi:hypothetical protein
MNPVDDPQGALLQLDFNSLSAKEPGYLLSFLEQFPSSVHRPDCSIRLMPNFLYSAALLKHRLMMGEGALVEIIDLEEMVGF